MTNAIINDEIATTIIELLKELSSELDLHYENEDFFALSPTMERMDRAADLLEAAGYPLPAAYKHVLARFQRIRN